MKGPSALAVIGVLIGIASVVAVVVVPMISDRPIVDYYVQAPSQLDFRFWHSVDITVYARNRGGNDAPLFINVTVVGAYVGWSNGGPFNQSSLVFPTVLPRNTEEYKGYWSFAINAAGDPSVIRVEFHMTKQFRLDVSGMSNWFFAEYNPPCGTVYLYTYSRDLQGLYKLSST